MATLNEIYSQFSHINKHSEDKFNSHLSKKFNSIGRARRFPLFTDQYSPGPGKYSPTEKFRTKHTRFGSSPRKYHLTPSDSPGPGSYSLPQSKGKCFSFAKRLEAIVPRFPGPGQYDLKDWGTLPRRVIFGTEVRKDNFLDPELSKNPEPWKYTIPSSSTSPKWKFGSEPRVKHKDISKLGVLEAMLETRLLKRADLAKFS